MELAANRTQTIKRGIGFIDRFRLATRVLEGLSTVLDLALRVWVANVFWKSGLTKIASWDTTLALIENEYTVPLLPPELAAVRGAGAEIFCRCCWCWCWGWARDLLHLRCSCSTSSP